jgi:hypothetical protein
MVRAREKPTPKKQDANHPILDDKPSQSVAADRNPVHHPLKKGPIYFVCNLVVMVAILQTKTVQKW